MAQFRKDIRAALPTDKIYRVQVGAYSVKANADAVAAKLKAAGYDALIV
jgi:cell division septation protein DedD